MGKEENLKSALVSRVPSILALATLIFGVNAPRRTRYISCPSKPSASVYEPADGVNNLFTSWVKSSAVGVPEAPPVLATVVKMLLN